MAVEDTTPGSEREQTDESLRVEREKADDAIGEKLAAIEETADAVIARARERADALLAAARAKTDRRTTERTPDRLASGSIARERVLEDRALRAERADADETVRVERAARGAQLATERDETDKDLSSERARADDALATRDEFLGIVSHDLRSMLNTMLGFAGLITKEVRRPDHVEQVAQHAKLIQRSGARMRRLVGDLVDLVGIEAGTLAMTREAGDVALVVTEAVENFQAQAAASGVSLVAEIVPPPSRASFDPARILQVITNLLGNAIKFTPAGGRVVARVERVGDDVRVTVSDTGVGIPADKLEAVFERFVQVARSDQRSVGLGLYISRCIVRGHGGRIWAERPRGEGSCIRFTIPLGDAP